MRISEETLCALEWDAIRELVAGFTHAQPAADRIRSLLPLADIEEARRALREVAEAMALQRDDGPLPPPYVSDQSATLRTVSVEGATLDGRALVSAARTLEGTRKLAAFLRRRGDDHPLLAERFRPAPDDVAFEREILEAFDDEATLVDAASPELGRLRREVRGLRSTIVEELEALLARLPHVMVAADSQPTVREGRYVVPLRREALSSVRGIVHDESASGATIFIEPNVVAEKNNALRRTGIAVAREEERILREMTAELYERRADLDLAARLALEAETRFAIARYALSVGAATPELGGDALEISGARHPLLLAHFAEVEAGEVVPLELALGSDDRTLIVTGPNTGGKTVLLKTVGVVALMAQSGITPPVAGGTRLPWFSSVFADIGDSQSIAQDLSTFTAHLTALKAALDGAGPDALILVDEIGASTDPAEGAALASALVEAWTARGARTIVTTHYHDLKILAAEVPGIINGSLAYDVDANRPRYRFVQGVPGRSFGLDLAARWGFPREIMAAARDRLEREVRDVEGVIDRLVAEEAAHRDAREALERERRAIGEAATARAHEETRRARKARESAERRLADLESRIGRLRDEIKTQQRKIRERSLALEEAEAEAARARTLAEDAARAAETLREERDALATERRERPVAIGDRVRIPRYDVVGQVVSVDLVANDATVQAGGIRVSCRASECEILEPLDEAEESSGIESSGGTEAPSTDDLPFEIDLRGLTADEVGFPLAGALEQAYHTGRSTLRVIHGKGTGVLRGRVSELLDKHPYVREHRLGQWNEGGAGVTIASIGDGPAE